jgi:putative ABC transport system permease protein
VYAGFNHERVLSFRLELPEQKYVEAVQQAAFFRALHQNLSAVPGVDHVAFSSQVPLAKNGWQTTYQVEGEPVLAPHERPSMEVTVASADYFNAVGIPLKRGRYFTQQDNLDHLKSRDLSTFNELEQMVAGLNTIVVDEEFVKRHWPNEDPIGKQVRLPWGKNAARQPLLTVVGVVDHVKLDRLNEQAGFVQAYFPFEQIGPSGAVVTIRTTLEPEKFASIVRQQIQALDADQPIYDVHTLAELRDTSLAPERLNVTLLGVFAVVALLLAAIGLYGVISYAIAQRTHELGLRMALGAQTRDVMALVMGQGAKLAVGGVAIGLAGAWGLTRLMSTLLFGVSATDPLTFALIALLLIVVALTACFVPARRATRVDPMVALRYE